MDPGGLAASDPRNPTSWNRYAYVNDDPVNFRDRQGLCGDSVGGGEDNGFDGEEPEFCAVQETAGPGGGASDESPTAESAEEDGSGDPDQGPGVNSAPAVIYVNPPTVIAPSDPSPDKSSQPPTGQPATAPCAPGQTGIGFGWTVGGSASASAGYALGGIFTAGGGAFLNGTKLTQGTFLSGGGTLGAPKGSVGNYPANNSPTSNVGLGGFAGAGGGIFITNAGNVSSLRGTFTSVVVSVGIFSGELDFGGGMFVASASVGKSTGLGVLATQTNTFSTTCTVP